MDMYLNGNERRMPTANGRFGAMSAVPRRNVSEAAIMEYGIQWKNKINTK
jgi:hypothetical protein